MGQSEGEEDQIIARRHTSDIKWNVEATEVTHGPAKDCQSQ